MEFINEHFKLLISLTFLIGGLAFFLGSIYAYVKAGKAVYWPVAEGIILTSDVVKETSNSTSDDRETTSYKAEISYSYTILKEKFVSNDIDLLPDFSTSSSKLAYEKTIKYAPGTKVEVYYNPLDPKEAILEPGVKTGYIIYSIISGLIFLVALGFVIYFFNHEQSITVSLSAPSLPFSVSPLVSG